MSDLFRTMSATAPHSFFLSLMQAPDVPRHYVATSDYNPGDPDESGISLTENQKVEVIGINQYGWWWVRATNASSGEVEEGWVPASYLKSLAHTQA